MTCFKAATIAVFMLLVGSMITAQEATPTEFPTRSPYNTSAFPSNLYCEDIKSPHLGPAWGEITIGNANIEELTAYVNLVGDYRTARYSDFVSFFRFGSEAIYPLIEACVDTETEHITALKVSINGSAYIGDFVALYGEPDVVTWGNNNISRTVFWFEEGIALSVIILEEDNVLECSEVGLVILFPFRSVDNFEDQWPYNRTNSENPSGEGSVYVPPPSEQQNPFDFDAIIATVTAQPSRTPTPTFSSPSSHTPTPQPATSTAQP